MLNMCVRAFFAGFTSPVRIIFALLFGLTISEFFREEFKWIKGIDQ